MPKPSPNDPAGHPVSPVPGEWAAPQAPAIPSFDSLRSPRRRTAIDLLVPQAPLQVPRPDAGSGPTRPPDYADLVRLGVRTARLVAGLPWRVARWSIRTPVAGVARLLGG